MQAHAVPLFQAYRLEAIDQLEHNLTSLVGGNAGGRIERLNEDLDADGTWSQNWFNSVGKFKQLTGLSLSYSVRLAKA